MTDYEHSASWHRYRAVLAQRFGVTLAREPVETWQTLRGHELHVDDWRPDAGPANGTVVLVHGGGGHGRILAPLGDFMAGLGWRPLAPDHATAGGTGAGPGSVSSPSSSGGGLPGRARTPCATKTPAEERLHATRPCRYHGLQRLFCQWHREPRPFDAMQGLFSHLSHTPGQNSSDAESTSRPGAGCQLLMPQMAP